MHKKIVACLFIAVILTACGIQNETEIPDSNKGAQEISAAPETFIENENELLNEPLNEPIIRQEKTEDFVMPLTQTVQRIVYMNDFTGGAGSFKPRSGGSVKISVLDTISGLPEGATHCLWVTGRAATWNGAILDMSDIMEDGRKFMVSAWVKYDEGYDSLPISLTLERNKNEYLPMGSVAAKKGEWTQLTGYIVIPNNTASASIYFETQWKTVFEEEDLCDFYITGLVVSEETSAYAMEEIPSLKEMYRDYFDIGAGIEVSDLFIPEIREIIIKHFDTVTCGNEMKADYLLDYAATLSLSEQIATRPVINPARADIIMDFALEHGLKVRGHVLIWHSQTPRWLFTEGYSSHADAPLTDRWTMIGRMENYIKEVLTHFQTKYPGRIFAWEVVNEAIETGHGSDKGYRMDDSLWYQVIGHDYIELAFGFARKYADPEVKLFYNDYNTYYADRAVRMRELIRELKEKDLIDGMGMQSHISMDKPELFDYENTIRRFAELGVEVHITELDIGLPAEDEDSFMRQGRRYARIAQLYKYLYDDGVPITSVTLWGIVDNRSWLHNRDGQGASYPLLFDRHFNPKPAFWGMYDPGLFGF